MERILESAEQALVNKPLILKTVRDTFENYYANEPDGIKFPIHNWVAIPSMETILKMTASHWHGSIDLTDPQDLRNFKLYVGKKD